jgi:hypothetical protein
VHQLNLYPHKNKRLANNPDRGDNRYIFNGERGLNMDKSELSKRFTEIVAMRLHAFDQLKNGVTPPNSVTSGWLERYRGTPQEDLPPYTVELNSFKWEVDNFVAMLMQAINTID